MNPLNEQVRIMRSSIENIDRILENEHIDYKKGEELKIKREQYAEELRRLVPMISGV